VAKKTKQKSLDDRWTQGEFAALLEMDQAVVSRAIRGGILSRDGSCRRWLQELYHNYAETAAGRAGGELNLAEERAKLAKMQAAKIGFDMARTRGVFVAAPAVALQVSHTYSIIRGKLLSLPHRLRGKHADLVDTKVFISMDELVRELLLELSQTRLPKQVAEKIRAMDDAEFHRSLNDQKGLGTTNSKNAGAKRQ
jgi:phage terminase Nu1 subunit (DNA packaging protein)